MALHRRAMLRSTLAGFGALTLTSRARAEGGEEMRGTILAGVQQVARSDGARFMFSGLAAIDPKNGAWSQVSENVGHARLSPDGKRLAQVVIGPNAGLWVGDLDGEEPLRAVFKPDEGRVFRPPIWSADGRSIVVTLVSGTREARKVKTVRLAPGGSDVREVPLPPGSSVFVLDCSKGGRMLALVQSRPPVDSKTLREKLRAGELDPKALRARQSLVLLGPDGKEERRIVEDEAGLVARFSPDGSRLLLTTQSPDGSDLWIEPVEGGERTRIDMTGPRNIDACWSPDGVHLAVSRFDLMRTKEGFLVPDISRGGVQSRVEVVSADGKARRTLPLPAGHLTVFDWR